MKLSYHEVKLCALAYHPLTPLLLSHNVDLLPHQITALYGEPEEAHSCPSPLSHKVSGILRSGFPIKLLLADETGLGKTVVVGLSILSLILRNLVHNMIIVTPRAVVSQWQDELLHKFGLYFKVIEHGDDFQTLLYDIEQGHGLKIVVSIDLIKGRQGQEFVELLPQDFVDLLVVDEAHHVITPSETLRFNIVKTLAMNSKSVILISATPFRGYSDVEYDRVKEILGMPFIYIRRFKEDAIDAEGRSLFPPRVSYTVIAKPSLPEWSALQAIKEAINKSRIERILKLVLLKRLASSLHAFKETINRLQWITPEEVTREESDDVEGIEPDELQKAGAAHLRYPRFKDLGYVIGGLVDKIPTLHQEPKERLLLDLIERYKPNHKVVVFTEYVSTLKRLESVLNKTDIEYVAIHGKMSIKERRNSMRRFWEDPKILVLLATDAAGEGINLQIASVQINYDIPWSPLKLEQRFGRIHRYGQKRTAMLYNIALEGTLDELIINKILRKLDNIAKLLGDWVYDYIGIAVRPDEVLEVVSDGLDRVTEKDMANRLERVKQDLHSPQCSCGLMKSYVQFKDRIRKSLALERGVSVLDVIRVSRLVADLIKNRYKVQCPSDVALGICRVGGMPVAMWVVQRVGREVVDIFADTKVEEGSVETYIIDRVRGVAQFYGFDSSDIEIYAGL